MEKKGKSIFFIILLVTLIFLFQSISAFSGSGAGNSTDPYQITNCTQLQEINASLKSYYILVNNINCSATKTWNGGKGFFPIANQTNETTGWYDFSKNFSGSFDGQGYTISDIYINRTNNILVGIFAVVSNATIKNVHITNVNITGWYYNGGLAAYLESSRVDNVSITGYVNGSGTSGSSNMANGLLFGFVGQESGNWARRSNITNCSAIGTVSGRGVIGLIAGFGDGAEINSCYSSGQVVGIGTSSSDWSFGGIIGEADSPFLITNSISFANVSIPITGDASRVGGIVGWLNAGTTGNANVTNSNASGILTGNGLVRGIAGYNQNGTIINSYFNGTINSNIVYDITNCSQLQNMSQDLYGSFKLLNNINCSETKTWNGGKGFEPIGGRFYGTFDGQGYNITGLYIYRTAETNPTTYAGHGLFNSSDGIIKNVGLVDADITVQGPNNRVGGLVGWNGGTINNSFITGKVYLSFSGSGYTAGGGLVGVNFGGTIINSYSKANVTGYGLDDLKLGGLIGFASGGSKINNSYATGNVLIQSAAAFDYSNDDRYTAGGFIGDTQLLSSNNIIDKCYATGNVQIAKAGAYMIGFAHFRAGGFIGDDNENIITNSYATGNVTNYKRNATSTLFMDSFTGGFVGRTDLSKINNSYSKGTVSVICDGWLCGEEEYFAGGFCGGYEGNSTKPTVISSYFDVNTSGWEKNHWYEYFNNCNASGKTTPEMKTQSTYINWNFTHIWGIDSVNNSGYPYLRIASLLVIPENYSIPQIIINSPTYTQTNNQSVNFNITLSDPFPIQNITLYIDGIVSQTNTTQCTNCTYTFIKTLSEGDHNWQIMAFNSLNKSNTTSLRNLKVDTTPPTITVISPTQYQSFTTTTIPFTLNQYDFGGLDKCIYSNNSGVTNYTFTCNTNFSIYETGTGIYNLMIWANDTLGNIVSEKVYYVVSLSAPSITINYPPLGYGVNTSQFDLNVTATDSDGIANISLWTNSSGIWHLSQTNSSPVTSGVRYKFVETLPEGFYKFNFLSYDNTGLSSFGASNFTFTVDFTPPSAAITSITTTAGSYDLSFSTSEADTNLKTCKYAIYNSLGIIDWGGYNTTYICNNNPHPAHVYNGYGTYTLYTYVTDAGGNLKTTALNFTVSALSGQTYTPPSGGGGGGGGGGINETINQTLALFGYCGDGICQDGRNGTYDRGEDFYSCAIDCRNIFSAFSLDNFNLETIITNCFSKDEELKERCVWNTTPGLFLLLILIFSFFTFSIFFEIKPQNEGRTFKVVYNKDLFRKKKRRR